MTKISMANKSRKNHTKLKSRAELKIAGAKDRRCKKTREAKVDERAKDHHAKKKILGSSVIVRRTSSVNKRNFTSPNSPMDSSSSD